MGLIRKTIKNNPHKFTFILLIGIVLVLLFFVITKNYNKKTNYSDQTNTNNNNYIDEKIFTMGIDYTKSQKPFAQKVSGAIIPHHQLASPLIAQFFKGMENQKPPVLILIGPNHFERGNYYALSSNSSWSTPYGDVMPDEKVIDQLVNYSYIQLDNQTVSQEFSVGTSMPFIKYYLPNTQIVPIIVSGKMTIEQTEKLSEILSTFDYPIIASVDFSHYLSSDEAQKRDSETLEVIEKLNIKRLFSLNNEYLDSPQSIAVLLYAMQKKGKTNFKVLQNTNSGFLTNDNGSSVTSYFSIIYF